MKNHKKKTLEFSSLSRSVRQFRFSFTHASPLAGKGWGEGTYVLILKVNIILELSRERESEREIPLLLRRGAKLDKICFSRVWVRWSGVVKRRKGRDEAHLSRYFLSAVAARWGGRERRWKKLRRTHSRKYTWKLIKSSVFFEYSVVSALPLSLRVCFGVALCHKSLFYRLETARKKSLTFESALEIHFEKIRLEAVLSPGRLW